MGRLAMVTGASSGIGEAYAERLAADGWDLIVVARRRERLEELANRLRRDHSVDVHAIAADLARRDELEAVCEQAANYSASFLVNNAGLAHYMPFVDLAPDAALELIDLNIAAPVLLTSAVLPGMVARNEGAVVNVASLLAFSGSWETPYLPRRAVYASTKAFLLLFTERVASELQGSGIRFQVLCPGVVRTEFHSRQGIDMSARPRMEAADVVAASLADLARGTIVSIPGADDEAALVRRGEAELDLLPFVGATELPPRYRP